jgi:putative adenylate-forming enzyme
MKLIILYFYLTTKLLQTINSKRFNQFVAKRRLNSLINFLKKQSPFYQKLKNDPFNAWPIINKRIMMDHFDELNTKNIKKDHAFHIATNAEQDKSLLSQIKDVTIGLSSGTSSMRGLVMASHYEKAVWSGIILAKCLPKFIFKKQKIALFLRANSDIYDAIISKTIEFRYYSLSANTQENILALEAYNPDVIVSPPSMLRHLADAQRSGLIHLTPLKIISAAEVLDPIDEKYIEAIFKMKLHQIYQCTEGFLASTCQYGTLHLNEDFILFEKHFIDAEKRKFVPVITDALRTTQPMVRYEHNDILTLKEKPCPCNSNNTALEYIEGRTDDMFCLPHVITNETVNIFPDIIRTIIFNTASTSFLEYKVVQHSISLITISLKGLDIEGDFLKCKKSLLDCFEKIQCRLPDIQHTPYKASDLFIKLKRVESRL